MIGSERDRSDRYKSTLGAEIEMPSHKGKDVGRGRQTKFETYVGIERADHRAAGGTTLTHHSESFLWEKYSLPQWQMRQAWWGHSEWRRPSLD